MKIDLHTHILPETWPDLHKRYGYGEWIRLEHHKPCCARMMRAEKFFREIEDDCWDAQRRLTDCDHHHVDVQVLSTVPVMFSYWARPEDTLDLSRMLNDHLMSVVATHPKRFIGLGTLPMQAPDLAVRELERCMAIGLAGVEIGTHINDWNLDDECLEPFWAAAEELGAAVFVHPWDMMGQGRMPRHWLPWLVSMPAETSLAICSLAMGGVLERYPNLRICFAHGGGSFPATIGRIDHGFNVRPDLCQTRTQTPPSELLSSIYIDSLVHDPDAPGSWSASWAPTELRSGPTTPSARRVSAWTADRELTLLRSRQRADAVGYGARVLGRHREDYETAASLAHSEWLRENS